MVEPFSAVLGQDRGLALLRKYIGAGAVPQGLLFTGEEGVGKEKAARAFAAALLCREPGGEGACGRCPDCRRLDSGGHPNFLFIEPETQFLRIDANNVELARVRYREGAVDFLRLLDAERTLLQAEDALAGGETDLNTSVVLIYKALGGGWEAAAL